MHQNRCILVFYSGEFGIVYKAKLKQSNRTVAVKTLKGRFLSTVFRDNDNRGPLALSIGDFDQVEVERFVEESLKMSQFKHTHVMSLIGVCLDAGSAPYIIMPYMANGSLIKYLKRERKNVVLLQDPDEDEVGCYLKESHDLFV